MFTPSFTHAYRCALSQTSAAKAASPPVPTLASFGVPRTYTLAAKAATKTRAQGPDAKRGAPLSRFEPRRDLASRALEFSQALGLCSMATWRSPSHFYSLPINVRALTSSNASSVVAGFNGELQQTATGFAFSCAASPRTCKPRPAPELGVEPAKVPPAFACMGFRCANIMGF